MKTQLLKISLVCVFLLFLLWVHWGNTALECNYHTVSSSRIPSGFDGYRIVQISDLHNTEIGRNNSKLLQMIKETEPDLIFITGDLIDSVRTDIDIALDFVSEACKIAPCYFVPGNHEAKLQTLDLYQTLLTGMTAAGVHILDNKTIALTENGDSITLMGIQDPGFHSYPDRNDPDKVIALYLSELMPDKNAYTVLLAHRPNHFTEYVEAGVDLVFTGHAHGGQFRLPFIGGLFAPGQGLFPEYDAGLYTQETTTMVVNRGIGNSSFPFRFNNRPEVLVLDLFCSPQP